MTVVLFLDSPEQWTQWKPHLERAFEAAGISPELTNDRSRLDATHIVYAPSPEVVDFSVYGELRAVLSMWAGVENVINNKTLTVPLTRMVEPGLTEGMAEYVLGHVMRHHLLSDTYISHQNGQWRSDVVAPLARDRCVGILGLGALGQAAAKLLVGVGFQVMGWSRTAKSLAGVTCVSGDDGLQEILGHSEILTLLLPLTPATRNILDKSAMAQMSKGAVIINPGRGPLIDDDALLAALDSGHLSHATLDVFRTEPLPTDHPFWAHQKITVTPHIAAATRPNTGANVIAENLKRSLNGDPLLHLVDRDSGY